VVESLFVDPFAVQIVKYLKYSFFTLIHLICLVEVRKILPIMNIDSVRLITRKKELGTVPILTQKDNFCSCKLQ
jgi:hypothetical protein